MTGQWLVSRQRPLVPGRPPVEPPRSGGQPVRHEGLGISKCVGSRGQGHLTVAGCCKMVFSCCEHLWRRHCGYTVLSAAIDHCAARDCASVLSRVMPASSKGRGSYAASVSAPQASGLIYSVSRRGPSGPVAPVVPKPRTLGSEDIGEQKYHSS